MSLDAVAPDRQGPPDPPGASPETAVPVAAFNAAVRRVVEESFAPLWVVGEVTNWRRASNGHCWFSLRDASAQLPCVMWRTDADRLPTEPREGMEVCAFGQPTLWEGGGRFQLVVRRVEARGEGLWRLALERLRRKLAGEGLLDEARKRPLPPVPGTVGVVTSRTGAALRDVVAVIRRRAPWTRIVVSHCRVQGEGAAAEIVDALSRLVRHGEADVVILTRGGGSVEDLWPFNEEVVARAIAASPVPTVSAVGHEVDVTIADLVADLRAPTPSAAAERAVPDAAALRSDLRARTAGLARAVRTRLHAEAQELGARAGRLVAAAARRVDRRRRDLALLAGRLHALSPLAVLERGFAVPLGPRGVLRSVGEFDVGSGFDLRVRDGTIRSRVEATTSIPPPETGSEAPGRGSA